MRPFAARMFRDSVELFRVLPVVGGQGASRRTFPEAGEDYPASVQTSSSSRTTGDGRVTTVTVHVVYTPTNIAAKADDKFVWLGRTLTVEAATVPKGIDDVVWRTQCLEAK